MRAAIYQDPQFRPIIRQLRRQRLQGGLILVSTLVFLVFALALAFYILYTNPLDTEGANLVGTILLLPIGAVLLRQYKRAQARARHVRICPEQFPYVYQLIADLAEQLHLRKIPNIYLVIDPAVNPCTLDLGARQSVLLGSDFLAGCRENETPEALRYMLAHQLGHIASRHNTYRWSIMVALAQQVPVITTLIARNLEFTADLYAAVLAPKGCTDALALCAVGKDNFPYVDSRVQIETMRTHKSIWAFIARWGAGIVTPAERITRLAGKGLGPDDSQRRVSNHQELLAARVSELPVPPTALH